MSAQDIKTAHKHAIHNREEILRSEVCACFYCLEYSQPQDITEWWDDDARGVGQTAVCPKCGIDSMGRSEQLPRRYAWLAALIFPVIYGRSRAF